MSREQRSLPVYQRYSDSGARLQNRAGVQAVLKAGDDATAEAVTWLVDAATLRGLVPRAEYDVLRDTADRWWLVKDVGELTEGIYPLRCERWKDGAA